jgi:predicted short-subunit dehydrogenase-like oxidoreductase (DUF2520 family)
VRPYRISFLGAGNVAGALCRELYGKGHIIQQIVSRDGNKGRALSAICNAEWSDNSIFFENTEILIVAVPDNQLPEVLPNIKCNDSTIVAHTAGSIGLDIFPENIKRKGIFYPLQTFSASRKPDISIVPFFIEASEETTAIALKSLAETISKSVYISDTEHRRLLHLAAVFVSNFTNHMFTSGKYIASATNIPFSVLNPLIIETVSKAIELGPENSQTGPAVRYDLNTIEKHMDLLSFSPELQNIYNIITKSIISYYKKS